MSEPTMQVPVSLIERAATAAHDAGWDNTSRDLAALLSQPTTTAEPNATHKLEQVRELAAKARWGSERWADPLPVPQYVLDLEAILDPKDAA